jgi:hypothetical protein
MNLFQMYQIFYHFANEETSIGAESTFHHELLLPVFTVCSDIPFKRRSETNSKEEYFNVTYR